MYFMCRAGNVWQNHTLVPLTFLPACKSNCSNISSISSSSAWPVSNNPILLHTQRLFEILHDQDDHSTNLRCINVPSPKWKQRCAKSVFIIEVFSFHSLFKFPMFKNNEMVQKIELQQFYSFFFSKVLLQFDHDWYPLLSSGLWRWKKIWIDAPGTLESPCLHTTNK